MKVNVQDRLQANPQLAARVLRASEILREKLGRSEPIVTLDWSLDQEQGRQPSARLKISDPTTSVTAQFTPAELADEPFLHGRLNWLWGDLLEDRSNIQVAELLQMTSNGDDD